MTYTELQRPQLSVKKYRKLKVLCLFFIMVVSFVMWSKMYINYCIKNQEPVIIRKDPNTKYVLLWTTPSRDPVKYLGNGKESFTNRKCPNVNCYVSRDRMLLGDVSNFDVIVFHSSDIDISDLPTSRSPHQKYVFASMESADNYPICDTKFDNFFNWTWTYKLNSDILYPYISIKDNYGNIIGPKENMPWKRIEDMDPINNDLKNKISKKRKAVAWFVSRCESRSKREVLVKDIGREMQKYGLQLDVYGACGTKECPRSNMETCLQMLQDDYYFYLSFENSLSPDYVTEKLFNALKNYVVPIVFGGANYTRYMPAGIYLDATKMTPGQLAGKMNELMMDKEQYYSYFKWHNHYSYEEPTDSPKTDPYCDFCSTVSQRFEERSEYKDFITWWSTPETCTTYKFNKFLFPH